jgi:hypothetical protein
MDIESLGFVIGLIGAVILKSSMSLMNEQAKNVEVAKSLGREPENLALKSFLRGLTLVVLGLGLETYARIFLG